MIGPLGDPCLRPNGFQEGVIHFQAVERSQAVGAVGKVPGQGVCLRIAQFADGKLLEVLHVGTCRGRGHGTLLLF